MKSNLVIVVLLVISILLILFFKKSIQKIYPDIKYIGSDNDQNTIYGEMTYKGIQKLYRQFGSGLRSFLDVGSGNGHLCLYMNDRSDIKKSVGIELVNERFEFAENLKEKLRKKDVSFINGSVLDIDLKTLFNEPVFVWWSNLCFDKENVDKISEKLFKELPQGSVLCCSQQVGSREFETTTEVEMTWDKKSNVYIYKV